MNMLLLLISFIAGIITVLAPCILPLLPAIIGGSISGDAGNRFNVKKAFTIVFSLGTSVIVFTLLLKASTLFIDIPEYVWKWVSGGIIAVLGIITLFPSLWESRLLAKLNAQSGRLMVMGRQKRSFIGDIIIGAALGPVFSTCSPTYFIVLATVLPANFLLGLAYLLAYTAGLCLSLFAVSLIGQKIMDKLGVAADPSGWLKKILGVVFLIVGLAIIAGWDKKTQLFFLEAGIFDVTKIEQKLLEKNSELDSSLRPEQEAGNRSDTDAYLTLGQKQSKFRQVPELSSIDGYINTDGKPVTLAGLRGKIVLLDIWTYSCINCQRTLPYINGWYAKYKEQGLEVVGLHTPEFAFEKIQANVEKAVERFGIKYPVLLDNDYSTWTALGNQFWPRKYLIDIDGYIVYDHIGEGSYEETEKAIQSALKERSARMGVEDRVPVTATIPADAVIIDASKVRSPETYFGSARNRNFANGAVGRNGEQTLVIPGTVAFNKLYLGGTWNMAAEYAENRAAASIVFSYEAKNVYITAGSAAGVELEIYKDGAFVKRVAVKEETLYHLIQDDDYGKHTLMIIIPQAGLQAFTFTFG